LNFPTVTLMSATLSHLMIVDVATGQSSAIPLSQANGYSAGTTSYLPNADNDLEYYPTVSPVSAGGYFWMFFTSRRTYGNLATASPYTVTKDPTTGDISAGYPFNPTSKKIWCSAISIGKGPGVDPSHPAFFLEGQELTTGNMRAFAALEACKEDGSACTGGSDCCSGHCSNIDPATGIGVCGAIQVNQCKTASGAPGSRYTDKCTQDSDCCVGTDNGVQGVALFCLGGFCDQRMN